MFKVLAGRMKSEVIIRFKSGRAEVPCGLKPSRRRLRGQLARQSQISEMASHILHGVIELSHPPRRPPGC